MKKTNIIVMLFVLFVLPYITASFNNRTIINTATIYTDKASNNNFISTIADAAVEDMKKTGVYASVTIGQAIVESGWGTNTLPTKYNNYFGMTAGGDIYVNGVKTKCTLSNRGTLGKSNNSNQFWSGMAVCLGKSEGGSSWWRVYDSVLNSIGDHSRNFWCGGDGRYIKNGVFAATDPLTQLYAIAESHYAVDGNGNITVNSKTGLRYDKDIYETYIKPYNLTQYDAGYKQVKPDYANNCTTAEYTGAPPSIPDSSSESSSEEGNAVSEFVTKYKGDIKKGYIYLKQLNNSLIVNSKDDDATIDNKVTNIINRIYKNVTKYTTTVKSGAEAYIANVSYLTGSFKNQIIYYKQGDYAAYNYGSYGTIKSHGCGPTSMAIVISSFKGTNVSPVETTNYACDNGYCTASGSSHAVVCALANKYGLNCSNELTPSSSSSQQQVIDALASGNSLVVVLAKQGHFTSGGHFFVLTGVDSSGNITVADPGNSSNNGKTYTFNYLINPTQGHVVKFWIISG